MSNPTLNIPLSRPFVDEEEKQAISDVIDSEWLTQGPKNQEFETLFSQYIGTQYAHATSSCTTALIATIHALGIRGEVIIPSFSWVATANAPVMAGATPCFADIEPETYCMNPSSAEALINKNTEAILPVHFAGQSANMSAFAKLAQKHNLALIEDSAETIGGLHKGKRTGSFGTGCFSFFPTKNMTTGEGGMVTTNDKALAEKIYALTNHGLSHSTFDREIQKNPWFRSAQIVGSNYRLTNFQAAMGIVQLRKLDQMNQLRRSHAQTLNKLLANNPHFSIPIEHKDNLHVYQMYIIRLNDPTLRLPLLEYLHKAHIGASVHFTPPIHLMPPFQDKFPQADLPITVKVSNSVVTLPMYPSLSSEQIHYIAHHLLSFFEKI